MIEKVQGIRRSYVRMFINRSNLEGLSHIL